MARIRSIHPGLFTDESFMSASLSARLLLIGIWTEAFDDGVFEWKPITLRARIFPVDSVDVPALLNELVELNFIQTFNSNSKKYGIVRNFGKYQRPKKPNSSGVLPNELRTYAAISTDSSEPVPNQFRTSGEKSPQMEDGEKGETTTPLFSSEKSGGSSAPPPLDEKEIERRLEQATGWRDLRNLSAISSLVADGVDFDGRVLPLARSVAGEFRDRGRDPPKTWGYLAEAVRDPKREAAPSEKIVETVFVTEGSPQWQAIIASGRKESYLRQMLKSAGDGTQGIYWAAERLPKISEGARP